MNAQPLRLPDLEVSLCAYHGCTSPGTVIVVTLREGYCFERCPVHARLAADPLLAT